MKLKPSAAEKSATLSDVSRDQTQCSDFERIPSSTVPEVQAETSNVVSDHADDPASTKLQFRSKPSPFCKSATLSDLPMEEAPIVLSLRVIVSIVPVVHADTSNVISYNFGKYRSEEDTAESLQHVEVVTGGSEGEGEAKSESVDNTEVDEDAENSSESSNGRPVCERLEESSRPRKRGRKLHDIDFDSQLALQITREDTAIHAPPTSRSKTPRGGSVQH